MEYCCFKDEEYFIPKRVLEENGIKVTTCSIYSQAKSVGGKTVKADVLLSKATTDYDAVIFVGGAGARIYFNDKKAQQLTK